MISQQNNHKAVDLFGYKSAVFFSGLLIIFFVVFCSDTIVGENLKVAVTSTKKPKYDAATAGAEILLRHYKKTRVEIVSIATDSGVAEQPVGKVSGLNGAKQRIENTYFEEKVNDCQVIFSFENYITTEIKNGEHVAVDYAAVIIEDIETGKRVEQCSEGVIVDAAYLQIAELINTQVNKIRKIRAAEAGNRFVEDMSGYPYTMGNIISLAYRLTGETVEPSDWHRHRDFNAKPRADILADAARRAATKLLERLR